MLLVSDAITVRRGQTFDSCDLHQGKHTHLKIQTKQDGSSIGNITNEEVSDFTQVSSAIWADASLS